MTKTFEATYAKHLEIKAQYEAAKAAGSDEGMEQARNNHRALDEAIEAKGRRFANLYSLYAEAMDVGNSYIDVSEIHQYRDEAELIAGMRECGIEAFTFSSGWSSAVDSAWAFTQNGCTLQGMVQINTQHKRYDGDGYDRRNAYLFKVL